MRQDLGVDNGASSGSRASHRANSSVVSTKGFDPAQGAEFSIADVLVWARTKPAGEAYNYIDGSNCALCHFLRDTGRAVSPSVIPGRWSNGEQTFAYDEEVFEGALQDQHNTPQDWTFGGLVKRLEKLAPETIATKSNWASLDAYLTDIELVSVA